MTYNILVIDGGGVKGLYSAKVISRCFEQYPELLTNIDALAGASTGAIIAAGLAAGVAPAKIVELYKLNLQKIFKDSYWDDIKDLGKLIGADYDYTNLKTVLKKYFGSKTLGELGKKILIPTFDLDNEGEPRTWKPKFFNNYQDSDLSELVVDVLVRAAVAPTYFPTYQGFIDGGLASNSPSICAIAQALDSATGNQCLSDINLLSIGPGFSPTYVSGKKLDWGVSQWAPLLIDMFFDSMKFTTEYQCQRLLGERYHRIDSVFKEKISLDDVGNLDKLIDYADQADLTETIKWLEKYWKNTGN